MIHFHPMPTDLARALQNGGTDANDQSAERQISPGAGTPCRHCLQNIPEGKEMLVFSLRPFETIQPYSEMGPAFLCVDACDAYGRKTEVPSVLKSSPDYLLKGYSRDERIAYGTGAIVPKEDISAYAETILSNPDTAFVDARSARNNCWLSRITRAASD
jgi:hypothetical protein